MSKEMQTNDIVLGKDYSSAKRWIAFFSIALIYFFYCFNFMVGTFVKPTMIYSPAEGGFGFTLQQTEEIFAVMSFGTIPGKQISHRDTLHQSTNTHRQAAAKL